MSAIARPNRSHPLNQGKVAWWLCQPSAIGGVTIRDIMGHYNGTLTGYTSGQGLVAQYRRGNGVALRGSTSAGYVNVGTSGISPLFPTTVTNFTVGGWVKANSWNGNYSNLIFRGNNAGGQFGILFSPSGQMITQTGNGSTFGNTLSTGVWYWLAYSCEGTALTLYQDGKQVTTGTGTPDSSVLRWSLGTDTQYSRYLDGWYDDIFVYNRVLRSDQIAALYHQSLLGHPDTIERDRLPLYAPPAAPSSDAAPWLMDYDLAGGFSTLGLNPC